MSPEQLAKMTRCLVEGATIEGIVKATGVTRQTISNQLKAMRAANSAYVRKWSKTSDGRRVKPVWAMGGRPDAARPTGKTGAMRQRAYRKRKKAEAQALKA